MITVLAVIFLITSVFLSAFHIGTACEKKPEHRDRFEAMVAKIVNSRVAWFIILGLTLLFTFIEKTKAADLDPVDEGPVRERCYKLCQMR